MKSGSSGVSLVKFLEKVKLMPLVKGVWRCIQLMHSAAISYAQFTCEAASALYHKAQGQDDLDFLRMFIKKRAHLVEKFVMMPSEHIDDQNCDVIAEELEHSISVWKMRKYGDAPFLNWAEKISAEYQKFFKNSRHCPLVGKKQDSDKKNFIKILRSRRSIRIFSDKDIGKDVLEQLVDAAKWAPTSCNQQGLRFLFIKNAEYRKKVSKTIPGGRQFSHKAPIILLVLADKRGYRYPEERFIPFQDAAAAIQNLLLMAEYLGLGACWCSYTSYSSVKHEKEIRMLLHIPNRMLICGAVALGWPAQMICEVPRDENKQLYSIDLFDEDELH